MAVVFSERFDTGPDGAAVTAANTAYDNVVLNGSGTAEFDSAQSVAGGMSCLATSTGTGDSVGLQDDFAARSTPHRRHYVRIPSNPPGNATLVNARDAGGIAGQAQINTSGQVRIRDGFTTVDTAVTALTANTWHRVEWHIDAVAGTQEARLFYGANLHGTTPDETLTGAYTGGDLVQFSDGLPANPGGAWSLWLDEVVGDDAAFPGPVEAQQPADPNEVFREDFGGVADGEVISTANTSFDEVIIQAPHTLVGDTAWSRTGSVSALFTFNGGTGASCKFADVFAREAIKRYLRWYTRFGSVPNSFDRIYTAEDSVENVNNSILTFDSNNRVVIANGQNAPSARQFAAGDEVRIEVLVDPGNAQQICRLYYADVDAPVDSYDEELVTALGAGIPDNIEIGSFNDGSWSMNVDSVVQRTDRWVGPEGGGTVATVGQAAELDTAQPVTAVKTVVIGQAIETDTARPVTAGTVVVIGQAVETDLARPLTPARTARIGRVFGTDTARQATPVKTVVIGQVVEDDVAQPTRAILAAGQVVAIGQAVEVDTATAVRGFVAPPVIRRRVRWQFIIGPAAGGHELSLTEARGRRLVARLSPNSEASFRIDGRHPQAAHVEELSTDLHVLWTSADGATRILHRGRVGATDDDIDADAHTVPVASLDYRALLERRILWSDSQLTWTQIDQARIAWELIQQTQTRPGGNLGISRGVGQTTGVLRDRTYEAGDAIGQRVQELSEVINGFDWDITPVSQSALHLDVYHPRRGRDRGVVLEHGGLAHSVRRSVDPGEYANAVRVTGDTSAETPPTAEEREAADLATRPEGRWDKVYSYPTIKTQGELDERADWQIGVSDVVAPTYTITLKQGSWDGPDHVWLGDPVRVVIKSGRLNVDTTLRVTEMQIDIPDTGQETVTLTAAAPSPSPHMPRGAGFIRTLRDRDRRLANLERR